MSAKIKTFVMCMVAIFILGGALGIYAQTTENINNNRSNSKQKKDLPRDFKSIFDVPEDKLFKNACSILTKQRGESTKESSLRTVYHMVGMCNSEGGLLYFLQKYGTTMTERIYEKHDVDFKTSTSPETNCNTIVETMAYMPYTAFPGFLYILAEPLAKAQNERVNALWLSRVLWKIGTKNNGMDMVPVNAVSIMEYDLLIPRSIQSTKDYSDLFHAFYSRDKDTALNIIESYARKYQVIRAVKEMETKCGQPLPCNAWGE